MKIGEVTFRADRNGIITRYEKISEGEVKTRCMTPTREKLPQVIHIGSNPPFKIGRTLKEASEEWEKQHPEQAANIKMALYDLSDKYPKVNCPACGEKMTWMKHGRFVFCFGCYSFVTFSEEGLEALYKKQGK